MYISFISTPGCLAGASGLVTPLQTCPVDRVMPSLSLRHWQAPNVRPPSPKLPQPLVDLQHIAPPPAIRVNGGWVGCSKLEHTALQVWQLVWYGGCSFAFQEQRNLKLGLRVQHIFNGSYVHSQWQYSSSSSGRAAGILQLRLGQSTICGPLRGPKTYGFCVACYISISKG